jgi:flagellin
MNQNGLDLDIELDDSGMIRINSRKYGSGQAFQVSSSSAGVLSVNAGEISTSDDGVDVKGTINGESTVGRGRLLTGIEGAKCIDGLSVRFFGDGKSLLASVASDVVDRVDESGEVNKENLEIPEEGVSVGRVYVNQNSMKFQVGGNLSSTIGFSLSNLRTGTLCSDVDTRTGYRCLGDIDVREYQGAQDALVMVDKAIERISAERGRLGAIQKNSLERNLSNLRVANENLISSESVIRDTDMAKEMATFTRNQIKVHSSTAMLAQANQVSENVLQLLE